MNTSDWDVVIVGAGAAGLSTALTLGRANRRVLVLDAGEPRNRFAAHVHGVLGSDGLAPDEFLARGRAEVAAYGVDVVRDEVVSLSDEGDALEVVTTSGRYRARRLAVASGSRDGVPDIPGATERWGKDLLHCPYCHGWEFRGRRLGVLATSSASVHQAFLVRQWSDDVTFLSAEAGDLTADVTARLAARGVLIDSRRVTRLLVENDSLAGVEVEGAESLALDALFTTPVLKANEEFLEALALERTDSALGGFVSVDKSGRTSNRRVWAVGNVARSADTVPMVVAAGSAAGAAINMDLIDEEFDDAVARQADSTTPLS